MAKGFQLTALGDKFLTQVHYNFLQSLGVGSIDGMKASPRAGLKTLPKCPSLFIFKNAIVFICCGEVGMFIAQGVLEGKPLLKLAVCFLLQPHGFQGDGLAS